jgi:hypothetical protein
VERGINLQFQIGDSRFRIEDTSGCGATNSYDRSQSEIFNLKSAIWIFNRKSLRPWPRYFFRPGALRSSRMVFPCSESLMSCARRFSRVSSFFALITPQLAVR